MTLYSECTVGTDINAGIIGYLWGQIEIPILAKKQRRTEENFTYKLQRGWLLFADKHQDCVIDVKSIQDELFNPCKFDSKIHTKYHLSIILNNI